MAEKIKGFLDKLEGEGYKSDSGHLLTNDRAWHSLRQETQRLQEREALLKANPAMNVTGLPPKTKSN